MTLLIKGMEMPMVCDDCWALDEYGDYPRCRITEEQRGYNFRIREQRMEHCPLIEVPTPHGRLKDVDVIIKDECHSCDGSCEVIECDCLNCTKAGCDTIRALNDAPTIIEAEE